MGAIVTLVPVPGGLREEADRVLDRFEAEVDLVGERGSDGSRAYVLHSARDVEAAANGIVDVLNRVAPDWRDSVALAL